MDAAAFVRQLQTEMDAVLIKLDDLPVAPVGMDSRAGVIDCLKLALKSELEASEMAALWLPTTPELDIKLALAQQCGDEARHFVLIQDRLHQLGEDASKYNPVAHGYSPLYHYLRTLRSTVERLAAGQFAREGIAQKRNRQFISYLEQVGDTGTAEMYRATVAPEEDLHHLMAVEKLLKYANSAESQEKARVAMHRTLELSDEMRELAALRTGVNAIPAS